MAKKNKKSDTKAKAAYKNYLEQNGFEDVKIIKSPSDISAQKNGETYYFEIKMTKQPETYFGAATYTEWSQAFKTPDYFKFVIAHSDENEVNFIFKEYTPFEFMEYSTIPPFKIYFNINLNGNTKKKKRRTAIPLTHETMALLSDLHDKMRK